MDCNTCDSSTAVIINTPEVVNVTLTITDKAKEMLNGAFGDDRSNALLVEYCLEDVPDTCMIYKLSKRLTKTVKNYKSMGLEFLFQMQHPTYWME